MLSRIWWGEAPERPNNFTEVTSDDRLMNVLRLRTRRAVILGYATPPT